MKIYKQKIDTPGFFDLELPEGSKILSFQLQEPCPTIWYKCDPNPSNPKEIRHFVLIGTGEDIPRNTKEYIGTIQLGKYGLVYHLFELNDGD